MKRVAPLFLAGVVGLAACSDQTTTPLGPDETTASFSASSSRSEKIPDQYVIVFKDQVQDVRGQANALVRAHGGTTLHTYSHSLKGFAAKLPPQAVEALRRNPNVAYIEQDATAFPDETTQTGATWGIDRVDQVDLPLSTTYTYDKTGAGVNAYVIDSGIRYSHQEFGGRASLGFDYVGDGVGAAAGDCSGHGTHVAGTIGGTTYGIAKGVNLVSVRVFPCTGGAPFSTIIAAVDWVTANHKKPAVTNMSLGGGFFQPLNDAVEASITAGVVYSISAGNNNGANACGNSPASAPNALTVGSTTAGDARSSFSNIGPCVDVFAPGSAIASAWWQSDTETRTISGTSMAAPHVGGVAALYLQQNQSATPGAVATWIVSNANVGKITDVGTGSPNRLLFSPVNRTPLARHGGPYTGNEGAAIVFDGSASSDADGDALTYSWDFGDGKTATGARPTHTYRNDGEYTVSLTVTDGRKEHTVTTTANVANVAPGVEAGLGGTMLPRSSFTLNGRFTDPGADAWTCRIEWGDGNVTTLAGCTPGVITASNLYQKPGTYTVTVTVTETVAPFASGRSTTTVKVQGAEPTKGGKNS